MYQLFTILKENDSSHRLIQMPNKMLIKVILIVINSQLWTMGSYVKTS
jgi:hypothetical protein